MKSEHIISDKTFHNCLEIFPKYSGIFLDILSTFHCSFPSFFAHVGKPRSPQPFLSAALVACSGLAASMSSSTSSSSSSSEPEAPKASGPVAVSAGLGVASGPRSTASSSAEGLRVCHTLRKARCCLLCSAQSSDPTPLDYGAEDLSHASALDDRIPWRSYEKMRDEQMDLVRVPAGKLCAICFNVYRALSHWAQGEVGDLTFLV